MFTKKIMSIGDWLLIFILMAIPFVNITIFIKLVISSETNKTLKNYLIALIIPIILVFVLGLGTGLFTRIVEAI